MLLLKKPLINLILRQIDLGCNLHLLYSHRILDLLDLLIEAHINLRRRILNVTHLDLLVQQLLKLADDLI